MKIHIHHYHHNAPDQSTERIMEALTFIINQNKQIMNKQEQFDKSLATLNEATNDIAQDLAQLQSEIASGNISEESLAKLETNAQYLKSLGASVENPVPEPTPVPTPEPTPNPAPDTPVE